MMICRVSEAYVQEHRTTSEEENRRIQSEPHKTRVCLYRPDSCEHPADRGKHSRHWQVLHICPALLVFNRILHPVHHVVDDINLNDMPYAAGAGFDPEKICLEGTRVEIIEKICLWASGIESGEKNVLLLTGFAGAGKSTIAHSVAERFRPLKRLASMFCFDRAMPADRHPGNIFRTIARDLADLDEEWKKLLSPHIQTREARTTNSPEIQFNEFILAPSQRLKSTESLPKSPEDPPTDNLLAVGPVVIIIDALDESAGWGKRDTLLKILSAKTAELPSNFRILITARAEEDIESAFRTKSHVHHLRMSDIESTDKDIANFVRNRLLKLKRNPKLDMDGAVKWLTQSAEKLFQWAYTACLFIEERGVDPVKELETLKRATSENKALEHLSNLDKLYSGILAETLKLERPGVRERFVTVIGWILAAREPLSMSSLRELGRLSGAEPNVDAVGLIIPHLGSLLSGVHDEDHAVVPLHTSFRDFLQRHYCQDLLRPHSELAMGTLRTMMDRLCFNICHLESSHVPNAAVGNLQERIKARIGDPLSYACRFWGDHLSKASYNAGLVRKVESVLMCDRILYWLEVLSLVGKVPDARPLLNSTLNWLPVSRSRVAKADENIAY